LPRIDLVSDAEVTIVSVVDNIYNPRAARVPGDCSVQAPRKNRPEAAFVIHNNFGSDNKLNNNELLNCRAN
jgi:hypothetical protein